MSVDWSRPIEVYHPDGRVMGASIEDDALPNDDTYGLRRDDGRYMHVNADGTTFSRMSEFKDWRVRNVASDIPNPHGDARSEAKGVSGYVDDPKGLQARCEALIRRVSVYPRNLVEETEEAQAILRLMDPIAVIIDDLMAQDMPERDRIAAAYEAGRNTPA